MEYTKKRILTVIKQLKEPKAKVRFVIKKIRKAKEEGYIYEINAEDVPHTVSCPHTVDNTKTIDEITEDIVVDQAVIGSCTNGRIDDLRAAAEILKGRQCKKGLRVIIIPGTQNIYLQALEEGLIKTFIEAGAVVSTPTCGPCLGGYMGILAAGERCVSTTNRNFVGRMGDVESLIYLASPEVAAASALAGYIANPEKIGGEE